MQEQQLHQQVISKSYSSCSTLQQNRDLHRGYKAVTIQQFLAYFV